SGYYKTVAANLFQAALQLGTGFKIMLSADNMLAADLVDFMMVYSNHANYFRYNGRPVLTTFQGGSLGQSYWQNSVLTPLRNSGRNIFFVPNFYTAGGDYNNPAVGNFGNPSYAQISADWYTNHPWWQT